MTVQFDGPNLWVFIVVTAWLVGGKLMKLFMIIGNEFVVFVAWFSRFCVRLKLAWKTGVVAPQTEPPDH